MPNNKEQGAAENAALQEHINSPATPTTMSLTGHLSEIKSRLTRIILVFVASVIVGSIFVDAIVTEFVRKGSGFSFVYIAPAELVTAYVKIVLVAALVVTSPVILYQIWGFVRPALKQSEKRMGFFAMLGGAGFFLLGAAFAYFAAAPFTINFFVNFDTTGLIDAQISFESYINFMLSLLVTFGLVFEMPMLTLFLSQLGIVKPQFLIKTRKYAILAIFIIAAIITPPDVVSQITVALPMIILYEISIVVCRVIVKRKKAKAGLEDEEDYEDDEDDVFEESSEAVAAEAVAAEAVADEAVAQAGAPVDTATT